MGYKQCININICVPCSLDQLKVTFDNLFFLSGASLKELEIKYSLLQCDNYVSQNHIFVEAVCHNLIIALCR